MWRVGDVGHRDGAGVCVELIERGRAVGRGGNGGRGLWRVDKGGARAVWSVVAADLGFELVEFVGIHIEQPL